MEIFIAGFHKREYQVARNAGIFQELKVALGKQSSRSEDLNIIKKKRTGFSQKSEYTWKQILLWVIQTETQSDWYFNFKVRSLSENSGKQCLDKWPVEVWDNKCVLFSVQFSSVAQACLTLCDPMHCSMPGFPVHNQLPQLAQTHVHWVGHSIHHLILSSALLLLPSIFPSIRVFSNESALRIRWPKNWSFSFSINPSNEYSGLISFRID